MYSPPITAVSSETSLRVPLIYVSRVYFEFGFPALSRYVVASLAATVFIRPPSLKSLNVVSAGSVPRLLQLTSIPFPVLTAARALSRRSTCFEPGETGGSYGITDPSFNSAAGISVFKSFIRSTLGPPFDVVATVLILFSPCFRVITICFSLHSVHAPVPSKSMW